MYDIRHTSKQYKKWLELPNCFDILPVIHVIGGIGVRYSGVQLSLWLFSLSGEAICLVGFVIARKRERDKLKNEVCIKDSNICTVYIACIKIII
jgi:hypothetical protein